MNSIDNPDALTVFTSETVDEFTESLSRSIYSAKREIDISLSNFWPNFIKPAIWTTEIAFIMNINFLGLPNLSFNFNWINELTTYVSKVK